MTNRKGVLSFIFIIIVGVAASLIAWGLTQNTTIVVITIICFVLILLLAYFLIPQIVGFNSFSKSGIVSIFSDQYKADKALQEKLRNCEEIKILTIRGLGIFGLKDSLIRKTLIEKKGKN